MKKIEGKRCLSILLVLVMVLGLLPTRLFTITARAADDVSYDSEASHFGFELKAGADKASGTDDDYLSVSRYTGSATAVEIPNTVTVSTLVSMGVLSSEQAAAYSVTELPVKEVGARFSSYSTSGITHIRLNASIEVIGYMAFAYMDALVDVDLSSDSKLTTINQYAFRDDGELTRVGMTESSTKTDKLPATLNSIGSYAGDRPAGLHLHRVGHRQRQTAGYPDEYGLECVQVLPEPDLPDLPGGHNIFRPLQPGRLHLPD